MPVIILLVVITISFIVVRIGAVAFELTGLPWERATFQALSAFTNAGFTTRESEDVTRHPVRRRIASSLIILGNAGLVTTIGSFATSIVQPRATQSLLNLGAIIGGVTLLVLIARIPFLGRNLREGVKRWLANRYDLVHPSAEELLRLDEGYVLTRFTLPPDSPAAGRTLSDLRLKQNLVQVLAIERGPRFHPIPGGVDELVAGDDLIVYGDRDSVERLLKPEEAEFLGVVIESPDSDSAEESRAESPA